ncbi:signal recognition particle receptor subunit alpha, partial [Acinetobacter baumannii]
READRDIGVRFSNAIAKTRNTIDSRLDSLFAGRRKIDDELLEELEAMLISTDIGVRTTMQILDAVRKEVSRDSLDDLQALKSVIKNELL